jgi:hypothetical protein
VSGYDVATIIFCLLAWFALLLFLLHLAPLFFMELSHQSKRLWFRHAAGWLLTSLALLGLGWAAQIGGAS